jgi:hypothetical protein
MPDSSVGSLCERESDSTRIDGDSVPATGRLNKGVRFSVFVLSIPALEFGHGWDWHAQTERERNQLRLFGRGEWNPAQLRYHGAFAIQAAAVHRASHPNWRCPNTRENEIEEGRGEFSTVHNFHASYMESLNLKEGKFDAKLAA